VPKGNKICPYCAEEVKQAAIVCKHCGRELPGFKEFETKSNDLEERGKSTEPNVPCGVYTVDTTSGAMVCAGQTIPLPDDPPDGFITFVPNDIEGNSVWSVAEDTAEGTLNIVPYSADDSIVFYEGTLQNEDGLSIFYSLSMRLTGGSFNGHLEVSVNNPEMGGECTVIRAFDAHQ